MVAHDIAVRGMQLSGKLQPLPAIVTMRDTDFPARLFDDLGRSTEQRRSSASKAADYRGGYLRLLQPVQRTAQVAMVDLACEVVGAPPVSPAKIESCGVVIRRVQQIIGSRAHRHDLPVEAWTRDAEGKCGWTPVAPGDDLLDPDATRRPFPRSGQAELDRLLQAHVLASASTEVSSPAFVAPPEVSGRLRRTIVYGLIPTASREVADAAPAAITYDDSTIRATLPALLQANNQVPMAGRGVDHRYMSADFCTDNNANDFLSFITLMQAVSLAYGAFDNTPEAGELRKQLNRRTVEFADGSRQRLGDFLKTANSYLITYDPDTDQPSGQLLMPVKWQVVTDDDVNAVVAAAQKSVSARSRNLVPPEGRFQDHTRLYRLRVFARIREESGCRRTVWSQYSEPFLIAPWYEAAGVAGPPVPLPSPANLKGAAPNVAFVVPDALMSTMQASTMKKLSGGSVNPQALGITWLCSFNIPIITVCAFIVLNIFLALFDIVFHWMAFIKICIPLPSAVVSKMGGEQ